MTPTWVDRVIYSTHFLASRMTDVMSPCDSNWSLHLRRFPHGKFIPSIDELHTWLLKVLTKCLIHLSNYFFLFLSVYLKSIIIPLYIRHVHQDSDKRMLITLRIITPYCIIIIYIPLATWHALLRCICLKKKKYLSSNF